MLKKPDLLGDLSKRLRDGVLTHPTIFLLADESQVRREVVAILASEGYRLRILTHPGELWENGASLAFSCLLCGHPQHSGVTGFQIVEELSRRQLALPVLFIASSWDASMVVKAIKSGAEDFLTLPLDPALLLGAIEQCLEKIRSREDVACAVTDAKARVASLNNREREVVRLVLNGLLNKEIADQMKLALITIKLYRARAMKKLGAGNAPEMVRIATIAEMCLGQRVPLPNQQKP